MTVTQDGNNNIFLISFSLVEGETDGGWGFFLHNLKRYVASQLEPCLISDRHPTIESAFNSSDNGW